MAKINLKPAPGYILIEPEEAEMKTASGIVLPESAGEKPLSGKVLVVGDEDILEGGVKKPSPVKVGDRVVYKKWGGNEMKIEGKEHLFVKFEDIIAVWQR